MSDTYEINAKLTADDSGFQAAFSRMDSSLNQWGINLDAMYSKGASFFKGFGVDVDQLASKIGTTGPMLATGIGVAVAAFTTLRKVIQETTKEFIEDETAQLKFNAALQANDRLTAGAADRLGKLAEKFAMLTGNSNAAVQSMIAMLSATGRSEDEINKMLVAAQGLATATGTDLNTALTQLNQTFSGTTGRLGRTTPELNNLTKAELENGAAVDVLLGKYGKFSDTLKDSSDVSLKNFNNQIGELKSILGGWFESFIKPIRDGLTTIVRFLVENKEVVIGVLNGIGAAIAAIMLVIAPLPTAIALVVGGIAALIGIFGKQKSATDDLIRSTKTYEDSIKNLTTAQLENQRAELLSLMAKTKSVAALKEYEERLAEINALLKEQYGKAAAETDENRIKALDEYNKALQDATRLQQAGLASLEDTLKAKQSATQTYLETLAKLGLANTKAFAEAKSALSAYGTELAKLGYTPGIVETPEEERARYESGRHGTTPSGLPTGATSGLGYGTEGTGFNASQYGGFSKLQEALTKIANTMGGAAGSALGGAATGAGGEAGKLFQSIAQYGPALGAVMYSLSKVFESMFAVLGPVINDLLKPLIEVFKEVGVILANMLLPVIELMTPIIQLLASVFEWFANKVMIPVANFVITIWNGIANAINAVLGWAGVHLDTVDVITSEGVHATVVGLGETSAAPTGTYSASYLGYAMNVPSITSGYTGVSGESASTGYSVPTGGNIYPNRDETYSGHVNGVNITNNFYSPRSLDEAQIERQQRAFQRELAFSGAV